MLTLFYASATFLQSWRIKCACNKLAEQLASQASVAFYALPAATADGFDPSLATSELCSNRNIAKVSEILWLQGRQRGCCLRPIQSINITPWISFSDAPSLLPFAYFETPEYLLKYRNAGNLSRLRILLETETQPDKAAPSNFLRIEEYGKLIAWRIDSHLAVLLETDIEYFTKLVVLTYLQNNLHINDRLRLLRIQSIRDEGEPQPVHLVASHSRKPTRTTINLQHDEWQKHLEGLRSLCVLANQATEFQYKQNLTEGKTGVVKPDLIPSEKKKKLAEELAAKSNVKQPNNTTTLDADVTGDANKKTKKVADNKSPLGVSVDGTRFTTTQVWESPAKLASSPSTSSSPSCSKTLSPNKLSELEKLAAATAQQVKQKSPKKTVAPTATITTITPPTPTTNEIKLINTTQSKTTSDVERTTTSTLVNQEKNEEPQPTKPPPIVEQAAMIEPDKENEQTIKSLENLNDLIIKTDVKNNGNSPQGAGYSRSQLSKAKPLNILIYGDSKSVRESIMITLKDILEDDTYTIYQLSSQQVALKNWLETTALLIVCGDVSSAPISEILVDYFLLGGNVLSLCSDILYFILPNYRTAEVREHELVQFSYDKWQKVKMMHHIFCYQPSPVKKNFSTDSYEPAHPTAFNKKQPALVCPRSIELKDLRGDRHNLDVKVLGTEEIWHTPSLLLATSLKSGGRAVFSQVHLESSPTLFESDESKYAILKQNDKIRLDILSDLLSKHLGVRTKTPTIGLAKGIVYQNAYFLGHHESKFKLLEDLRKEYGGNTIKIDNLTLQFCGRDDKPMKAESNFLPILTHSCPEDFSTVDYFDNLKTKYIGRLLIYSPIITSTMHIVEPLVLTSGLVVVARQQTNGTGRSGNQWLSPLGCAMSSIQLHIKLESHLGQQLAILQHLVGTAIVNAFKSHEHYKVLDLGIKWPNDIYVKGTMKIGGLITKTIIESDTVIAILGFGINLDNSKPTTCLNDLIKEYNISHKPQIPLLKYETLLALIFNELERIIDEVQNEGLEDFYDLYLKLWLHSDQMVKICHTDGKEHEAKIIGVDDNCFLRVRLTSGAIESVQPDGNSFDMLKGLIVPKYF